MRIQSNFRDYYDLLQAHGPDNRLVFHRKFQEVDLNQDSELVRPWVGLSAPCPPQARFSTNIGEICLRILVVLFAGKRYTALEVSRYPRHSSSVARPSAVEHFYSASAALAYLEEHLSAEQLRDPLTRRPSAVKEFVERLLCIQGTTELEDWALAQRVPIALLSLKAGQWKKYERRLVLNPKLASVHFFRVKEPWQAYQELAQFLGGLAAPENTPRERISDQDRLKKRGFDKYSFRRRRRTPRDLKTS